MPQPPPDEQLRECRDCGLIVRLPRAAPGQDVRCPRCDRVLRRWRTDPLNRALACAAAAIPFYMVMVTSPFLTVETLGRFRQSMIVTGPEILEHHGLWEVGFVVLLTSVLLPLANLACLLVVLLGLRLPRPPRWLYRAFLWFERLDPWAMIEVYLIGLFVAYTRLVGIVHVDIGPAAYGLVGLMLALVGVDAALDRDAVWELLERAGLTAEKEGHLSLLLRRGVNPRAMGCHGCHKVIEARPGEPCPRCGSKLCPRRPRTIVRTWALVIAAAVLYIPANLYPVMNILRLGRQQSYTIVGGVEELFAAGLWPLAVIVFAASIAVPVLKLIALVLMLLGAHRGSANRLLERTRLYRVIGVIGRWSMIDVFMVSILVALVRFGVVVQVTAGSGAAFFAGVVILTMLATEQFDPRVMWDAAARNDAGLQPAGRHAALAPETRPA